MKLYFLIAIFATATVICCESEHTSSRRDRNANDDLKSYHSKRHRGSSAWRKLMPAQEKSSAQGFGGPRIGRVTLHRSKNLLTAGSAIRAWRDFKQRHNKQYETEQEEQHRFSIFLDNIRRIEHHNTGFRQGIHKFKASMNEFGDMTHSEFVHTLNGFKRNYGDSLAKPHASLFIPPHHVSLPDNVDWRTHGYVTPVKNQGHCGSCWSFSACGALEGQHKRKNGTLVSLSEQNLVDCSGPFGNQGCNGGLMDQAFQYIKANDGIDTEQTYPYEAKDDRCRYIKADEGADDTGFMDIPKGNESILQMAVGTVGPVSVAIDASHQSFQFYESGIYFEPNCSPVNLDHGVLVIGYGINEDGVEYWLVKNSWGTTWGEEGYIKMARNRNNMCGIASSASYPLV